VEKILKSYSLYLEAKRYRRNEEKGREVYELSRSSSVWCPGNVAEIFLNYA